MLTEVHVGAIPFENYSDVALVMNLIEIVRNDAMILREHTMGASPIVEAL